MPLPDMEEGLAKSAYSTMRNIWPTYTFNTIRHPCTGRGSWDTTGTGPHHCSVFGSETRPRLHLPYVLIFQGTFTQYFLYPIIIAMGNFTRWLWTIRRQAYLKRTMHNGNQQAKVPFSIGHHPWGFSRDDHSLGTLAEFLLPRVLLPTDISEPICDAVWLGL